MIARSLPIRSFLAGLAIVLALGPRFANASEEAAHGDNKEKPAEEAPVSAQPLPDLTPAEQYCSNIIDAAAAAQIAQQKNNLEKVQKDLDRRVELVVAKTEELKAWIKRREEFTAQATDSLLQIYGKMKPDAAAAQLVTMNEFVAAAILSKLSGKTSSVILSQMDAGKAARLSSVIAGAGEIAAKRAEAASGH